jgi:anaerobic glycerol-3-phosphate dehydrogenase
MPSSTAMGRRMWPLPTAAFSRGLESVGSPGVLGNANPEVTAKLHADTKLLCIAATRRGPTVAGFRFQQKRLHPFEQDPSELDMSTSCAAAKPPARML